MTTEERQKFITELKEALPFQKDHGESTWTGELCEKAAHEIELLAKRVDELEQKLEAIEDEQWSYSMESD